MPIDYGWGAVADTTMVTVGSGQRGLAFYSDQGSNPPGVTFVGCSLR